VDPVLGHHSWRLSKVAAACAARWARPRRPRPRLLRPTLLDHLKKIMKRSSKQAMCKTELLTSKVHHNRVLHGLVLLMLLPADVAPV
jgi:hypothetical protein